MGRLVWVLLLAAAACNKKPNADLSPQKVVDQLAASKQPALVGRFKDIQLSETLVSDGLPAELCRARATIAAWCELKQGALIVRAERIPIGDAEKRYPVETLRITLPATGVRDKLVAAWGPSTHVRDTDYWFAPASHLRVALHAPAMPGDPKDDLDLDFSGYWPLDEFLGHDRNLFGFERGAPLLGATVRDVRARYTPRDDDDERLVLWPVDTAARPTEIVLDGTAGAPHYTVNLTGVSDHALTDAMTRKFGAGTRDEDGLSTVYATKPRIDIRASSLEVGFSDEARDSDD